MERMDWTVNKKMFVIILDDDHTYKDCHNFQMNHKIASADQDDDFYVLQLHQLTQFTEAPRNRQCFTSLKDLNCFAFLLSESCDKHCPFLCSCQMDLGRLAPASEFIGGHTLPF
jgi:hypothetical protein